MKKEKWQQAKALFLKALSLDKKQWTDFVEQHTLVDQELKEILLGLLSGNEVSRDSQSIYGENSERAEFMQTLLQEIPISDAI